MRNRELIGRILHFAVSCFQAVRRAGWFVTRPKTVGVHGIPITPEGKVVLVTLSYARGWRLPGGGKKAAEDSRAAMLRELKEEIGLTSYESADLVSGFTHRPATVVTRGEGCG
jgi:8-oxo-dGTP pyrophosphatase MutT (NUDIX family)